MPADDSRILDAEDYLPEPAVEMDAHRHRNPDGSEGGWIANTAHVDPMRRNRREGREVTHERE